MKELASRLGSLYRASSGTVYPVLKQLEKERSIEFQLEEGRKMYRLTRVGKRLLSAESEAIAGIWNRAEKFEDLGQQMGPHSAVIAGPLAELNSTALKAAVWAAGEVNRENRVRQILRSASGALNKLIAAGQKRARRNDDSR